MAIHEVVIQILIPIAVGLGLRLVRLFGDRESAMLRRLVVYVSIPFLVFYSMYTAKLPSVAQAVSIVVALPLLTGIFHLVGRLASRFEGNPDRRTALLACITFGNYGWLGWSAVYTVLGNQGLNQALFFTLLWWPVFYGFGALVGADGQEGAHPGLRSVAIVTALPLSCILAGILLNLGGVSIPDFLLASIRSIGETTIPLILISVGMGLTIGNLKPLLLPALLVSVVHLGLGPLVGLGIARLLPVGELGSKVILIQSAMPVATVTPILSDYFAMDRDLVSVSIVLSTVLSLVTLPLVLQIVI